MKISLFMLVQVCCCSPEHSHTEKEKFILYSSSPSSANQTLFLKLPDLIQAEQNVEKPKLNTEKIFGRNVELYQLQRMLIKSKDAHRIISVVGSFGVGKYLLVKTAARYVTERGFFPGGTAVVVLQSNSWLLSLLNDVLFPPPNKEASSFEEMGERLTLDPTAQRKIVILMCQFLTENNPGELVNMLAKITLRYKGVKFVVIGQPCTPHRHIEETILRENINPMVAYSIIKMKYPEWKLSFLEFVQFSPLVELLNSPWICNKAADLLRQDSLDETFHKLWGTAYGQEELGNKGSLSELFTQLTKNSRESNQLMLLSQMSTGFLFSDPEIVWDDKLKNIVCGSGNFISKLWDVYLLISEEEIHQYQNISFEVIMRIAVKILSSYFQQNPQFFQYEFIFEMLLLDCGDRLKGQYTDTLHRFNLFKEHFFYYMDPILLKKLIGNARKHQQEKNLKVLNNLLIYKIKIYYLV